MRSTTPLHSRAWIESRLDDDRGKLYRAACACGTADQPWHEDHTLALAAARAHRTNAQTSSDDPA